MKNYSCFGLDFLGQCNYDPTNPTVYFSIGQLIPLLAIAIAVYQILSPIVKLRIVSNKLFQFHLRFSNLNNWMKKLSPPEAFKPLFVYLRIPTFQLRFFYYLTLISIFSLFFSSIIPSICEGVVNLDQARLISQSQQINS